MATNTHTLIINNAGWTRTSEHKSASAARASLDEYVWGKGVIVRENGSLVVKTPERAHEGFTAKRVGRWSIVEGIEPNES